MPICIETSAPLEPIPDYELEDYSRVYTVSAQIVEVGSPLQDDPEDVLVGGWPCGGPADAQVRLRDEDGYLWTVGWDAEEHDSGSTAALLPGMEVELLFVANAENTHKRKGVVLSDERGPLLVLEASQRPSSDGLPLTAAERGFAIDVDREDTCEGNPYDMHPLVTISSSDASISLRTGGIATLPVDPGPRNVTFVLAAAASYIDDCFDVCDGYFWVAWALPD